MGCRDFLFFFCVCKVILIAYLWRQTPQCRRRTAKCIDLSVNTAHNWFGLVTKRVFNKSRENWHHPLCGNKRYRDVLSCHLLWSTLRSMNIKDRKEKPGLTFSDGKPCRRIRQGGKWGVLGLLCTIMPHLEARTWGKIAAFSGQNYVIGKLSQYLSEVCSSFRFGGC